MGFHVLWCQRISVLFAYEQTDSSVGAVDDDSDDDDLEDDSPSVPITNLENWDTAPRSHETDEEMALRLSRDLSIGSGSRLL